MNKIQQFPGKIDNKMYTIQVNQKQLSLLGDKEQVNYELSLSMHIQWLFYGDKVIGFQIDELRVEGLPEDMIKLKIFLGCLVTFGGIRKFYTFEETLYSNENNSTKVKNVEINRNFKVYACKSFKKSNRQLDEIFDEINLILNLQGLSFTPIVYEVFESKTCIYLIMEYCYRKFDDDFTDEELKVIIQSLLVAIKNLQGLKIAHKRISRSHIMFDNENQLKLIGFRNASIYNVSDHEYELDIYKVGTLMYKFYQKKNKNGEDFPTIPDHGNEFLKIFLDNSSQYVTNIDKAISHPYFSSLQGEGLNQKFYSMNPKFKKSIEDKGQYFQEKIQKYHQQNQLQPDFSTELQN